MTCECFGPHKCGLPDFDCAATYRESECRHAHYCSKPENHDLVEGDEMHKCGAATCGAEWI